MLNGPNLNLLGIREPEIYGEATWVQIEQRMQTFAAQNGVELELFQSNHEGELIDRIQECHQRADCIIINAGD